MLRYFYQFNFGKVHSIGPIYVCTNFEINRYKIEEFRKHAKIVFYLTSRDAKTVVVRHGGWIFSSVTFCNQPVVSTTSGSKVMAQTVVLMFLMTLTFELVF